MSKDLKERIIKILDEWDDKWNNDLSDEEIADQILEVFEQQPQYIVGEDDGNRTWQDINKQQAKKRIVIQST